MKKLILLLITMYISFSCKESEPKEVTPDGMYHRSGEVQVLFENDPDGINLVFMGDGFIKEDLKMGGTYEQKAAELIYYLFTVPPFSTYQQYFNAYVVYTESRQRVLDGRNTVFNINRDTFGSFRINNYNSVNNYKQLAVPSLEDAHITIILANTDKHSGTATQGVAISYNGYKSKRVVVHEVGHTFANLADEYIDSTRSTLSWSPETYANVDDHNDLGTIKWTHFVGKKGYEAVGAYEGGLYVEKGIWRPEETSIMMGSSSVQYFNVPSREAIVKRIFEIKGIPYSFEAFLATDVIPSPSNARIQMHDKEVLFNCMQEDE